MARRYQLHAGHGRRPGDPGESGDRSTPAARVPAGGARGNVKAGGFRGQRTPRTQRAQLAGLSAAFWIGFLVRGRAAAALAPRNEACLETPASHGDVFRQEAGGAGRRPGIAEMINDRPVGSSEEAGRALQAAAVAEQSVLAANGAPPAERLAALAAHASRCTACGLAATRNTVVFGEGNPEAPLMLIGEGPGQNEDATGRPFVGRSGALLDECLRENGILRKHVFVCNIIKCRACLIEGGRAKNRPPRADEVEACSQWLDQQLAIIEPLVIVCLGAPAANALIHKNFHIMQERGRW